MLKSNVDRALAGLALLSFLPFLFLLMYWHPVGTHGFDWLSNWGGRFDDVSWLNQQREWYATTMGRYTSTGLLSTTSWWYTLERARLVITLLLLSLPFALAYVVGGLMKWRFSKALLWSLILVALWLSQVSNPYDTLYRWSGLLTYHVGLLLTLLYAGALLRQRLVLATAIVALAVGTNEISLIQCGMLTGAWWWLNLDMWKQPKGILLLVVAAVCATIALSAPGNFNRSELYTEAGSYLGAALLTGASSVYLWLGWLGSGLLPLFICLVWLSDGEKLKLTKGQVWVTIVGGLLIVPLSLAPVLIATRGDSLPEGITDWQILPILLILLLLASKLPTPKVSKGLYILIGIALLLPPLLGGLGIDRSRQVHKRSSVSRIMVTGKAGNGWIQLLSGSSAAYDDAVRKQYAKAKMSSDTILYFPSLPVLRDNYLYDPTYDRRFRDDGEPFFGYAVGKTTGVGKYMGN